MRPFRAASVFLVVVTALFCVGSKRALSQAVEAEPLIPQNLLKLVHTPEVQRDLGLEGDARMLDVLRSSRVAIAKSARRETSRDNAGTRKTTVRCVGGNSVAGEDASIARS